MLAQHLARADGPVTPTELALRVRELAAEHGGFWSKSAREPGAEPALVEQALTKLEALGLARRIERGFAPRPALARYAVGDAVVKEPGSVRHDDPAAPSKTTAKDER